MQRGSHPLLAFPGVELHPAISHERPRKPFVAGGAPAMGVPLIEPEGDRLELFDKVPGFGEESDPKRGPVSSTSAHSTARTRSSDANIQFVTQSREDSPPLPSTVCALLEPSDPPYSPGPVSDPHDRLQPIPNPDV